MFPRMPVTARHIVDTIHTVTRIRKFESELLRHKCTARRPACCQCPEGALSVCRGRSGRAGEKALPGTGHCPGQ
eukprot:3460865-Rhodomonas_salina.4